MQDYISFNGDCPQCNFNNQSSSLQLNSMDFWECGNCNLQLSTFPPEAVILGWRGKGKFRVNKSFLKGEEFEVPLFLAKADKEGKYPFMPQKDNSLFLSEDELKDYLLQITANRTAKTWRNSPPFTNH